MPLEDVSTKYCFLIIVRLLVRCSFVCSDSSETLLVILVYLIHLYLSQRNVNVHVHTQLRTITIKHGAYIYINTTQLYMIQILDTNDFPRAY